MKRKRCPECKQTKVVSEFYGATRPPHVSPYCKLCTRKRVKAWRQGNRDKYRISRRKMKYGITEDDYKLILKSQNFGCAICGAATSGNTQIPNLAVDHCHTTERVRGLLCHACNVGIGSFRNSVDLLRKAIQYLESNLANANPMGTDDTEALAQELGLCDLPPPAQKS